MIERGFAKLPAELREIVYECLCSFDHRLIVTIPNPNVPFLPKSRWSTQQHIVWRIPEHVCEPAVEISGLTTPRWCDINDSRSTYLKGESRLPPPVYLLCSEIYTKAIQRYYRSLTFGFWSVAGFSSFLAQTSPLAAASIRSLIVEAPFHLTEALLGDEAELFSSFSPSWQSVWTAASEKLHGLDAVGVHIFLHAPLERTHEARHDPNDTAFHHSSMFRSIAIPLLPLTQISAKHCRITVRLIHHFEYIPLEEFPQTQRTTSPEGQLRPAKRWSCVGQIPDSWVHEIANTQEAISTIKKCPL